MILSFP